MKKYLAIVEKPSLCQAVKESYINHRAEVETAVGQIDFIALAGHVCTWLEPNDYKGWNGKWEEIGYPMLPAAWEIKPINDPRKMDLVKDIRDKVKSGHYDGLINCCDSDTEGTGIFWLLVHYLRIENMTALRFMEHSLTDKEILASLLSMKPTTASVHERSAEAFLLRSQADWLYGMNATRMMTVKTGELMTVGRVKAPTIKMVYDNSRAIEKFTPERYIQTEADYGEFCSVLIGADGSLVRLKGPVKNIPLEGVAERRESQAEEIHAPRLYDLTSIQSEAGQAYGYTPAQTLMIVQSLYEKHKLISYPRTQCRYISSEKAKEFPVMLQNIRVFADLASFVDKLTPTELHVVYGDRQVVNDAEVAKEAHDALLPTDKRPDLAVLSEDEKNILHMIAARLLSQFLPKLRQEKTKLFIRHGEHLFLAQGKTIPEPGWRILYAESKDRPLPDVREGDHVTATEIHAEIKETLPPRRLTQATLISAMKNIATLISDRSLKRTLAESQGIGTPATRAAIIKDIIDRGYVADRKGLHITEKGKRYVEGLQDIDILDPVFAAVLDMNIKRIQRGEAVYREQYAAMVADLKRMCSQINVTAVRAVPALECHVCGMPMKRTKYSYLCGGCGMKIPRVLCGVEITTEMLSDPEDLARPRKFISKAGRVFSAGLMLSEKGFEFIFQSR